MRTFYFNTGVRPFNHTPPAGMAYLKGFKDSGNGVFVIPFDCDIEDNVVFEFACDNPSLYPNSEYLVREIHNSILLSKYAYFKKLKSIKE